MLDVIHQIIEKTLNAGLQVDIMPESSEQAKEFIDMGVKYLLQTELGTLNKSLKSTLDDIKNKVMIKQA